MQCLDGPSTTGLSSGLDARLPTGEYLRDQHGRTFTYLRLAITDRCNFRCVYCMPKQGVRFQPKDRLLSTAEILRLIRVTAALGVSKLRLTGGEPLICPDLPSIVAGARDCAGIDSVHLTTNGALLAEQLPALMDAGLTGVNVSLDSLRPDRFRAMTRGHDLEHTLAAIELAVRLGVDTVKINVVTMRGFNDEELADFAELSRRWPVTVRFIELMPFDTQQVWKAGHFMHVARMSERLHETCGDLRPAEGSATEHQVFAFDGAPGKVALIPSHTRSMCGDCNRLRITADGCIRNCLFSSQETDLKPYLRGQSDDLEVAEQIRTAMWDKPADGWEAQRAHEEGDDPSGGRVSMTQIGG